ncbi:MAG: V-type ATPase subunit, partial [Chloroflexi bacterium]|nr:V-type ATPase subunit [Chloroflexota bacterium]
MFIFENFGLLGKTLAKVGKMLSDQDFQNLLSLHSVPEIASYLQKTPAYQQVLQEVQPNEIHRRDLEILINQSTIYELLSLREFASLKERIVIDFFLTGFEIENLKLVTKHVVLSTQASLGDIEKK